MRVHIYMQMYIYIHTHVYTYIYTSWRRATARRIHLCDSNCLAVWRVCASLRKHCMCDVFTYMTGFIHMLNVTRSFVTSFTEIVVCEARMRIFLETLHVGYEAQFVT